MTRGTRAPMSERCRRAFPRCMGQAAMGRCTCQPPGDVVRAALIRLLWRSVADQDTCDGRCEEDGRLLDICGAMRALGWGKHWSARVFQDRALFEPVETRR